MLLEILKLFYTSYSSPRSFLKMILGFELSALGYLLNYTTNLLYSFLEAFEKLHIDIGEGIIQLKF
jgi:hypothetical protein